MCDTATLSVLECIISRRVSIGNSWESDQSRPMDPDAMFTAFDISREAQLKYGVKERHVAMKRDVHAMFDNGKLPGYNRSSLVVKDGLPKAWVYHPISAIPDKYKSRATPSPIQSSPIQSTLSDEHSTDGRGRICIPANLVARLGLNPTDWAYAIPSNYSLIVSRTPGMCLDVPYKYRVDSSNNIRISSACLNTAGLTGKKYEIKIVNDKIIINES